MANSYIRECRFCRSTIRMAEMYSGQWLPFELDGSGKHECTNLIDIYETLDHQLIDKPIVKESIVRNTDKPVSKVEPIIQPHYESTNSAFGIIRWLIVVFLAILLFPSLG